MAVIGEEAYPVSVLNMTPDSAPVPAGDINGDGVSDWLVRYENLGDDRTVRLDDRTNKTFIRFGGASIPTSDYYDQLVYEALLPVEDFIGSNNADAVTIDGREISIFEGTASGYATPAALVLSARSTLRACVGAADVDGDGHADLVFEAEQRFSEPSDLVVVFGASTPSDISISQFPAEPVNDGSARDAYHTLGNVDADPEAEVVRLEETRSSGSGISIIDVTRSGTSVQQAFTIPNQDSSAENDDVSVAQLDGQGLPEIITGGAGVIVTEDGSSGTYSSTPVFVNVGFPNAAFAYVGDVNGDGLGDIYQRTSETEVGIVYGTGTLSDYQVDDLNAEADIVIDGASASDVLDIPHPPALMSRFGDVNNDGVDDVLVSRVVAVTGMEQTRYSEPSTSVEEVAVSPSFAAQDYISGAIEQTANIGLWDGDADDDYAAMVVKNEPGQPLRSEVWLYEGDQRTSSTPDHVLRHPDDAEAITIVPGDFNGNGVPNLAVAWLDTDPTISIYEAGQSSPIHTIDAASINAGFTTRAAPNLRNIGDVNDDGVDDILIAMASLTEPEAYLYFGGSSLSVSPDVVVDYSAESVSSRVGFVIQELGDINADGIDDFAVAAENASPIFLGDDFFFVHFGKSGETSPPQFDVPDVRIRVERDNTSQLYGVFPQSATVGDFNGDSFPDLAASPIFFSLSGSPFGGGGNAIRIYNGGPDFDGQPDEKLRIPAGPFISGDAGYSFLRSHQGELTGLPDLDGDGSDEFLFAKQGYSYEPGTNAAIFSGNGSSAPTLSTVLEDPEGEGGIGTNDTWSNLAGRTSAVGDFDGNGIMENVLPANGPNALNGSPNHRIVGAYVFSIGCTLQYPFEVSAPITGAAAVIDLRDTCAGIDEIGFDGASGSGTITVEQFAERPTNRDGIPADANVSEERFVIRTTSDFSYTEAGITIPFSTISGITNPSSLNVYQRSTPGTGTFNEVRVFFNPDNMIVVTEELGEFVIASANNPLPVELSRFEVQPAGAQAATLTWSTLSETGNAGFRVQHRLAGESSPSGASASWTTLGFVDGAGTTTEAQSYRFDATDLEPGTHSFRLEKIDADGTPSLSPERTARISTNGPLFLSAPAPHPVQDRSSFAFVVEEGGPATVTLYNLLGQRVATLHDGPVTAGERVSLTVDAVRLGAGTYFVRLTTDSASRTERMTVVR